MNYKPPCAGFLSLVSINEASQSHNSSQSKHVCVETQPSEIYADFLPIILPVQEKQIYDFAVYVFHLHTTRHRFLLTLHKAKDFAVQTGLKLQHEKVKACVHLIRSSGCIL